MVSTVPGTLFPGYTNLASAVVVTVTANKIQLLVLGDQLHTMA